MITVPAVRHSVPNFRPITGLTRGMGDAICDDAGNCYDDTTGDPLGNVNTGGANNPSLPPVLPPSLPISSQGPLVPGVISSSPSSTTASGTSAAQILAALAQGAGSGATIYKALQTPSLVPGTNLVYNPGTGQLQNALGISAGAIGSSLTSSVSSLLPLLLLGGLAVLVFSSLKK